MDKITVFPRSSVLEDEACQWIIKFESDDEPSKQDIQQLNAWLSKSPVHKQTLLRLSKTWSDMDVMSGLMIPLGHSLKPSQSKLKTFALTPLLFMAGIFRVLANKTKTLFGPIIILPAVTLVIMFSLSFLGTSITPELPNNMYITSIGEHSSHTLEDGSVLTLNSNSQVEVNYTLSKRVINLLRGEAHFDVTSDPDRPFEVYADNRMVKAIGTAFSVYRLKNNIEVLVTEGKVALAIIESTLFVKPGSLPKGRASVEQTLSANPIENTVTVIASLVAGQSISIPISSNSDSVDSVDSLNTPVIEYAQGDLVRKLSWLDGRLVFAGESLEEVVAEVSRHTPLLIEVTDPELKKLRIGGQFQAGETDALFDVLESGFGIKITRLNKGHVQLDAK
ncbi:FecR domain-containing protein [uncultured Paraglaciecola sp.]|jgi:transmembrane sensor|uniref:FecR family protein n=1 Tax=uncultured Paraglaciecola sp. TaxID=1765024 RepID=UPI0025CBAB22|nr:FecR domain-containing protein [uncultured Paraglaciecola sp.]